MREMINACKLLAEKPERKDSFGDLVVDEMKILKQIVKKDRERLCIGFNWLRTGIGSEPL
jgi:hypothetical protein